jgi:hypothetical protein
LNDQNTIVTDKGIRCLSPTEFTRTKVKAWQARRAPRDVEDVVHMLRYFHGLDFNRINPQESMDELAEEDPRVAEKWAEMMQGEEDDNSVDTASVDRYAVRIIQDVYLNEKENVTVDHGDLASWVPHSKLIERSITLRVCNNSDLSSLFLSFFSFSLWLLILFSI